MPSRNEPKAPAVVERFMKQLYVTFKAVKLYPPSSNIPRENAAEALAILRTHFQRQPDMRLVVAKDQFYYDTFKLFPEHPVYGGFARDFYNRKLSEIRFHSGARDWEVTSFLSLLLVPLDELAASGGFEARLWDLQVDNVTVKEVGTKIVDAPTSEQIEQVAGEQWPPTSERIDDIISGAFASRPRDQRLLVRVMEDPKLVARYLKESLRGRGARPDEAWLSGRIAGMAHIVANEVPVDQAPLFRSLLEAMMELDEPMRGKLLRDKLLPEARNDEAIAQILRSGELEELCAAVAAGMAEGFVSRDGLARAIRNLALIGLGDRERVMRTTELAMRDAGASDDVIASVLADAAPTTLRVRERPKAEERPVDNIMKLIDLAPVSSASLTLEDPGVAALAEEARAGITDGDVLGALVNVVTVEQRPAPFATMMSLIEDGLELLLERGDFDIAADVAAALTAAEADGTLEEGQRRRVRSAIALLAKPRQMRLVNNAMRLYRHDTREYLACRRLLAILGGHAIGPLLEVLADEPDMTARKAIVDLISDMADRFIDDLGERVGDQRWFFVRNVVSILARVRDPRVLTYLGRTLRYPDARVRRETIRALAGVRDRLAHEMLLAALEDDDGQNVQLAARYLGSLKARGALEGLLEVARGDGKGNRDVAVRVEAIEALGRIGSQDAIPTLDAIVRQRAILGRGSARELKAAAEAAIETLREPREGGGQ